MNTSMDEKTIFASGVFDLFHYGHLRFLERARALGGALIVGVQTDERVIEVKGKPPVYPLQHRLSLVAALDCVDMAFPIHGPGDERVVVRGVDIWAIGPDHHLLPGHESLREELEGVECVVIPRTPGISTSEIKEWCR
jgi:cytidyltransferase-like protein